MLDKPTGFTSKWLDLGTTRRYRVNLPTQSYDYSGLYGEYAEYDYAGLIAI